MRIDWQSVIDRHAGLFSFGTRRSSDGASKEASTAFSTERVEPNGDGQEITNPFRGVATAISDARKRGILPFLVERNIRHALEDVLQETEFRRAVVSAARSGGSAGYVAERSYVVERITARAAEFAELLPDERRKLLLNRLMIWLCLVAEVGLGLLLVSRLMSEVSATLRQSNWDAVTWIGSRILAASETWSDWNPTDRLVFVVGVPFLIYALIGINKMLLALDARMTESWNDRIRNYLRPAVRVALNEFASLTHPTRLLIEDTPGLAEVDRLEHYVPRQQFDHVTTLTSRLGARAVAVSGPRGVGKTALLHRVCSPEYADEADTSLRVRVSAPVSYSAREFLVHLYRQVCRAVLESLSRGPTRSAAARRLVRLAKGAWNTTSILLVGATWLTVAVEDQYWLQSLSSRAIGSAFLGVTLSDRLMTAVLLTIIATITEFHLRRWLVAAGFGPAWTTESREAGRVADLAAAAEGKLAFLETVSIERSSGLGGRGVQLGRSRARQLIEQPTGLPDLVRSYREFVTEVVSWLKHERGVDSKIIVGIDEVDRIADAEEADRFLNSIKSVFDARGCVYVVTISDEALADFERRAIHVRSALDSAFDDVIRLEPMTFDETSDLLRRRVIGFPSLFVALCHCLSGGLARDVVRAARTIVAARIETREVELGALIRAVVSREILMIKRGFAEHMMKKGLSDESADLMLKLEDVSWPGQDSDSICAAATALWMDRSTETPVVRLGEDIATGLLFYGVLLDAFGDDGSPITRADDDVLNDRDSDAGQLIESLATVRAKLPSTGALAYPRLLAIRDELKAH